MVGSTERQSGTFLADTEDVFQNLPSFILGNQGIGRHGYFTPDPTPTLNDFFDQPIHRIGLAKVALGDPIKAWPHQLSLCEVAGATVGFLYQSSGHGKTSQNRIFLIHGIQLSRIKARLDHRNTEANRFGRNIAMTQEPILPVLHFDRILYRYLLEVELLIALQFNGDTGWFIA